MLSRQDYLHPRELALQRRSPLVFFLRFFQISLPFIRFSQQLFIVREFGAPRELVFKAHTDPNLYVKWVRPHGYEMTLEEFEPVSGGRWRFTHKDKDGNSYGFHGTFHKVSLDRMLQTFEFDGSPGHVSLETLTLEELPGGRTRLTAQSVYQSVADRDGMIGAGMERGVNDGYERLDEILEKMAK